MQALKKVIYICLLAVLAPCLSCCISDHTEKAVSINNSGWGAEVVQLEYENLDTISKREIYLFLKTNTSFNTDSLTLYIKSESPAGNSVTDTIALYFPGNIKRINGYAEVHALFRREALFSEKGVYTFSFSHDHNEIRGIEAIGIKTE